MAAMNPARRLSHARGYLELGMLTEAAAELAKIPASEDASSDVLTLRVVVLQEQKDWANLRIAAAELARRKPGDATAWIIWAYAVRRAESLEAAEQVLLEAEHIHPDEPTIQFNLGCYACQLGALGVARRHVARAIALDAKFAAAAATDPDLAPLRELQKE